MTVLFTQRLIDSVNKELSSKLKLWIPKKLPGLETRQLFHKSNSYKYTNYYMRVMNDAMGAFWAST